MSAPAPAPAPGPATRRLARSSDPEGWSIYGKVRAYESGPRVDGAVADSHCSGSAWYGQLAEARARCDRDPACEFLHHVECDSNMWRACGTSIACIEDQSSDPDSCTEVPRGIYVPTSNATQWLAVAVDNSVLRLASLEVFADEGSLYAHVLSAVEVPGYDGWNGILADEGSRVVANAPALARPLDVATAHADNGTGILGVEASIAECFSVGALGVERELNFSVWCRTGIRRVEVCCATSCGACGGYECDQQPGGPESCCRNRIRIGPDSCCRNMEMSAAKHQEIMVHQFRHAPVLDFAWTEWVTEIQQVALKHCKFDKPKCKYGLRDEVKALLWQRWSFKMFIGKCQG